jgi:hypothetical protein
MLGMAFLAKQRAVVFDLTEGRERVGIIPWGNVEEIVREHGETGRDHVLQFVVGGLLALGVVGGWRWYQSKDATE